MAQKSTRKPDPVIKTPAVPVVVRIRLQDALGVPLKSIECRVWWYGNEHPYVGYQTDADGVVTMAVPTNSQNPVVYVPGLSWTFHLAITNFGTVSSTSGLTARLNNLGLLALDPSTDPVSYTSSDIGEALERYKALKHLPAGGSNEEAVKALAEDHDGAKV